MAGTKWEQFLEALDSHGITADAEGGNTPKNLAEGLNQALEEAERLQEQYEMMLLYVVCMKDQTQLWKESCDRLDALNQAQHRELQKIPHEIVRKMKERGMTPPKGVGKVAPKKFETVDPRHTHMAKKLREEAQQRQKAINANNPIPSNVMSNPTEATAWGRAMLKMQEAGGSDAMLQLLANK
ncbi:hypothetical protein VH22019_00022 [Vibrio phage VH2_2019]|nr:hypothetical protein VH22019_00022 [Vibrio phage VH2_2019]